jgi:hypothetical protein
VQGRSELIVAGRQQFGGHRVLTGHHRAETHRQDRQLGGGRIQDRHMGAQVIRRPQRSGQVHLADQGR